ncbi:hypothetical protein PFLUV_G00268320 [Perca fluviatilis]|uniref:Uncharacterized protein n=1 Tax=Perca fluviatilis TaxID=8168 RepID=A0A6A5DNV6_PERFL|nr:hypothetical protein PFLUV_G00268320 [Perca fluviatilis]
MDVRILQMKYFVIIHIACLHIPCAESGVRLRTGWRREADWTSILPALPLTADTGRQQENSFDTGATRGTDTSSWHGGLGGSTKRKKAKKGRVRHFGKFNSDTHGCSGVQTRSCSASSDCSGCLGLYTCNLLLGTCQLKGLSQQTDKFLQTLRDF